MEDKQNTVMFNKTSSTEEHTNTILGGQQNEEQIKDLYTKQNINKQRRNRKGNPPDLK